MRGHRFLKFLFKLAIPLTAVVLLAGTAVASDGGRSSREDTSSSQRYDDGDDDRDGDDGSEQELTGIVSSISTTQWVIGGQTFQVNSGTEIEGRPSVGSRVKVEYYTSGNRAVAREIERKGKSTTTRPPVTTTPPVPTTTIPLPPPPTTTIPPPPPPTTTIPPPPTTTPPPPPPTVAPVSYTATIQPILNSCTGCHGGTAGVTLSSYSGTRATVTAGNAAASRLYNALISGGTMQGYTSSANVQLIADWIDQGALNN